MELDVKATALAAVFLPQDVGRDFAQLCSCDRSGHRFTDAGAISQRFLYCISMCIPMFLPHSYQVADAMCDI